MLSCDPTSGGSANMSITTVSRRRLLVGTGASLASYAPLSAIAQSACPENKGCATVADLSIPKIPGFEKAGQKPMMLARYRPHREGSYRLEKEEVAGKWIVHNYGHSGAGITMSLGCAEQVVLKVEEIIKKNGAAVAKNGIAVLGGGVMGLTAARALAKRYQPATQIDLFTKEIYSSTTSSVAGGQWAPSGVDWDENDSEANDQIKTILRSSHQQFTAMMGPFYGVSSMTNYTLFDSPNTGLEKAHRLGLIKKSCLKKLPFAKMNCSGFAYETLLVEPPVFLKRMHDEVFARLTKDHFHASAKGFAERGTEEEMSKDVAKLKQKIIVNCTGIAGNKLFKDKGRVVPIKGQLVLLPPQSLGYLFSGYGCDDEGWAQYMFPRKDHLVLGGTYQHSPHDEIPHDNVGKHIARGLRNLFEKGEQKCSKTSVNEVDQGELP